MAGLTLGAAAVLVAAPARALDCQEVTPGSPTLYGLGGSAQKPLLQKVATLLANQSPPTTIVYQAPGACLGINGLVGNTSIGGTASYWDTAGKEQTCTLGTGHAVDFAAMGNSAPACNVTLPADVGDFLGPVNAYALIVPTGSSQTTISAEAAYFVFGFGQQGQAQPWVDDSHIFRRDANSAAQLFIGFATGVPVEKFKGIDTKTNAGTVTAVAQAFTPEKAIGLVSGEVADASRATVRTLAFQAKGQRCGFWPDSSPTAFDKKSVRNGQYSIWAPLHFFARVDGAKKITNPDLARFIGLFTGEAEPPAGVNVLEAEIKSGNVPRCAMSVWRDADYGPVSRYVPDKPCGCYFDSVATGKTSCQACSDTAPCPGSAPACRHGFCEAK